MLRVMPITGALAAVLAAAPGALAQVTSSTDTAKSPWPTVNRTPTFGDDVSADSSFIRQAMRGNYTEVALGRLAESRAEDDTVESFAERMISDHNSMNQKWTALAHDNDMKVVPDFGTAGQQTIDRLEDLDGNEFDQAYVAEMIRRHEQDLATFGWMRQSARSSEVRQLASTSESAIRQHLALARQVGSRIGISTTAGRAGGVPVNQTPTVGDDVSADSSFIRQATRGNYTEVALGRLAESRAENDAVESFAERMSSDHNSMNQKWTLLANENDVKVLPEFGTAGQQTIDRLEGLDGNEFDQAYMAEMIRRHEQDLATFGWIRQSARSSEVRQLASTSESAIREHLALARQVGSRVGISTTAGRAGGVPVPAPVPTTEDKTRRTSDGATGDERDDRDNDGALRSEDRAFVQNVLQDHLMHIKLAQRAQREAKSDETRRLAERMEKDFTQWQENWEGLAARYDVKAPTHLGNLHGKKVDKLEKASKGSFDQTYASIVADHLASVVPYFEKEGQEVGVAAARRLVDDELPMIRENLSRAKQLKGKANEKEPNSDRK